MLTQVQINKQVYEECQVAEKYNLASLQNAEALIFIKYGERILGKRVLDIGCGGGRTAFFLTQIAGDYAGVDYSAKMVNLCKRRFPGTTFAECDYRDMRQFANDSYDFALFSFNGMDYVDHQGRLRGLTEIYRVLKTDGLFVFSSHNLECGDIGQTPSLNICLNPRRLLANIKKYRQQIRNYSRNKKLEVHGGEYSILNDCAIDWSLLTYYITIPNQVKQVERAGFHVLDIYDCDGKHLSSPKEKCTATWIYYVAIK